MRPIFLLTLFLSAQIAFAAGPSAFKPQVAGQDDTLVAPPSAAQNFAPIPASAIPKVNTAPAEYFVPAPPTKPQDTQTQNMLTQMLPQLMSALESGSHGDAPPPANTNWSKYSYPDDYKFYYGGKGAGNIGNGLCTEQNKNRTQISKGYCDMLLKTLNDKGSCANNAMNEIIADAGSGSGISDLRLYCSTYPQLNADTKPLFFQQILAALITQESGWDPGAQEKPWTRADGKSMGGKGLFQIGVDDSTKYPNGCSAINNRSIFDPQTNINCGACIALSSLAKDKTMGHGSGDSGAVGMARYFGPMRDLQAATRSAMASAVNNSCQASTGKGDSGMRFASLSSSSSSTRAPSSSSAPSADVYGPSLPANGVAR